MKSLFCVMVIGITLAFSQYADSYTHSHPHGGSNDAVSHNHHPPQSGLVALYKYIYGAEFCRENWKPDCNNGLTGTSESRTAWHLSNRHSGGDADVPEEVEEVEEEIDVVLPPEKPTEKPIEKPVEKPIVIPDETVVPVAVVVIGTPHVSPQVSVEPNPTPVPQIALDVTPPAIVKPTQQLMITEYMVRDWSVWNRLLPQWVEIYNPNTVAINLKGYMFQYMTYHRRKGYLIAMSTIGDLKIPAKGTVLVVTRRYLTSLDEGRVFNLDTGNVLKKGFALYDPEGDVVVSIPYPQKPVHQENRRVSFHRYKSLMIDDYAEPNYYGHNQDISTAGVHDFAPPAAPTHLRMKTGMWVNLKKQY